MTASFTLESTWQPAEGGTTARHALSLSYEGDGPLRDFRLGVSGPARISSNARIGGGRLVRQLSNYAELAPEPGFVLNPGERWTIEVGALDYPLRHWTDATTAGFVILSDGSTAPALTLPPHHATLGDERRRGTMMLDGVAELPVALLPFPRDVSVEGRRSVPPGLDVADDQPAAEAFRTITELLFPGEGLVRSADEGGFPVRLVLTGGMGVEDYGLEWDGEGATVTASKQAGLFHGLITLGQIQRGARLQPGRFAFPASGRISDSPQMSWRGCHLDVARRFYGTAELKRFLAILAWNKLNVFHWHLSDDEAFRVEIEAFPELTRTGAWRGHGLAVPSLLGSGPEPSGGVYSRKAVQELVAFAASMFITVVPEIDMPGHCYAMLKALPQLRDPGEDGVYHSIQSFPNNCLNPAVEAVYPAVEAILGELFDLFPGRYFHVGADEVPADAWHASPLAKRLSLELGAPGAAPLQAHFLRRVQEMVSAAGRITGAWEEAAQGGGIDKAESYMVGWHDVQASQRLAAEGYRVVVAPGQAYYLDMANGIDWREPGAGWAGWSSPETTYAFDPSAGWSEEERTRLMGVQACIWSEPMSDRAVFDRLVFPRLSAIAETGWTAPERKDFLRSSAIAGLMPNLYGTYEGAV